MRESWRKWGRESRKVIILVCLHYHNPDLVFLLFMWSEVTRTSYPQVDWVKSFKLVSIHCKSHKHYCKHGVLFLAEEKVLHFSLYTSLLLKRTGSSSEDVEGNTILLSFLRYSSVNGHSLNALRWLCLRKSMGYLWWSCASHLLCSCLPAFFPPHLRQGKVSIGVLWTLDSGAFYNLLLSEARVGGV